jgi:hypothetical protein
MRRLLKDLGYKEKCVDNAHVFFRSKKDLVIFRLYHDEDALRSGDISSTRQYLHMRGYLAETDFDSFFGTVNKSA